MNALTPAILDFVRELQPVTVPMACARFDRSPPYMRDLLNTLADTGQLALAPAKRSDEDRSRGRPPRLYCLPDWPGLTANAPEVENALARATADEVLAALTAWGRGQLADLRAAFEQDVRDLVLGLVHEGRLAVVEDEGLTYYEPIA